MRLLVSGSVNMLCAAYLMATGDGNYLTMSVMCIAAAAGTGALLFALVPPP